MSAVPAKPHEVAPTRLGRGWRPRSGLARIGREISSGALVGFLSIPFCVTAGVLAYEPLGRDYVPVGAAAGILCGVAGGVAGALARTSSFVPTGASTTMALIQASFVGGVLAHGADARLALAVMPLAALLAGFWQVLIAASGLARAIKFTPYPVLAGFLTGLAILIFWQQMPRLFDEGSLSGLIHSIPDRGPWTYAMPVFGIGIVLLILWTERRFPRAPALLVGLVVGTVLFHLAARFTPDLHLGRTVGTVSLRQASLGLKLDGRVLDLLSDFDFLKSLALTSLTLALLGTLDLTFSLRAAQDLHDFDVAPRRDLAGAGLANVVAGLVGGLTVTTSISFARTIFSGGGRTRLSTVSVALVLLFAAALAPSLVAALPSIVLSALLVAIAIRLWDRWCITLGQDLVRPGEPERRIRARRNAAIVVAVAAVTVLGQPVMGALLGVVLSCLVFIMEMSRPIVRRRLDGSQLFSKRIRSLGQVGLLRQAGSRHAVLELQGVLFFGNADDLASAIRHLEGAAQSVILDLKRVTDLDTSGAAVLRQIASRCRQSRMRLAVSGAGATFRPLVAQALGSSGATLHPTLDAALETIEDETLAAAEDNAALCWGTRGIGDTDLASGLSADELELLERRLRACSYPTGALLCRTGEPADRLWVLTRGSVSVRIATASGPKRIAGLGPGTSVGEMGLLDRRPRSADVVADEPVEAFMLTATDFDELMRDEPHLGQALLATVARVTAQRLRTTSEELMLADI